MNPSGEKVPGACINLGNGEASAPVHNDRFDFSDEAIGYGAALFGRLVERTLVPQPGALGVPACAATHRATTAPRVA